MRELAAASRAFCGLWGLVPGGGVEPPRPEGRRILSPLRLPVPPSRHFVEVLDLQPVLCFYSFFPKQQMRDSFSGSVPTNKSLKGNPYGILPLLSAIRFGPNS
jgi:hypothetical protein